jgi:cell division protein FtsW
MVGLAFLASSLSTRPQEVFLREFFKQLFLGIGLGSVICFFLARLDYHELIKRANWFLILNFTLLGFLALFALYGNIVGLGSGLRSTQIKAQLISNLDFLPIKPHMANGAIRWIDFPFLPNFQPSEFTKLGLLVYFAYIFQKFEGKKLGWMELKKPLYAFILSAFLIILQPDLGTVLLTFVILFASMWSAKIPLKFLATMTLSVAVFGVIMTAVASYRVDRVLAFLDSSSETGGQIRNVQSAIQNGGMFGKGYGNSEFKQRPGILYEQSTDAIIAIIGEETGFVGSMFVVLLYLLILWRGLKTASLAPDVGGRSLAAGITVWIVSQAFLNIGGMTGLVPLTGVPLPLISQGGSAILINLLSLGILLNISSQTIQKQKSSLPKRNFKGASNQSLNKTFSSKTVNA